jgi:diguanylate cyclase (GGDEF)-like protein
MNIAAALIYWIVVAMWTTVLVTIAYFFWRNPRAFGTTRLLLAVLAIDTLRNIVENTYFGLYFGSRYQLFPASLVNFLGTPTLVVAVKSLNVLAGMLVLYLLFDRWLPKAINERRDADQRASDLHEMAMVDDLTELSNRRSFQTAAKAELARAHRYKRPLSLLLLDVDCFKTINDQYGHATGDQVLVDIARICQLQARANDIVARLGGDEFAILLPETDCAAARAIAERLREALKHRVSPPVATITVGIAQAFLEENLAEVMKNADCALYEAKNAGRDRVGVFSARLRTNDI